MGKNGASSWFTVVRKAFSSPIKENDQRSSRIREDNEQEEEEKRRRKRRWIFKMPKETVAQQCEARIIITTANIIETCNEGTKDSEGVDVDQSHAIAITIATAATSPAAVARAQAAVDVDRLARPSICVKEYHAAVVIQSAFRGFLARIALRALRGVVTLQALVRGHNVRNRAQMTLRCMQAMLRVQTRMCKERAAKLSDENSTDYRKSMSNEYAGDNYGIFFGDSLQTVPSFQHVHSKLDEDALKREIALAYAFSHQIWGTGDDQSYSGEELDVNPEWSSQWSGNDRETGRASSDQREPIKIVEIDTYRPYPTNDDRSKNQQQNYCHQQLMSPNSLSLASPGRRASNNQYNHSPLTPSPVKARHLQVHSASPRCLRWSNSMPQMSGVVNNYFHGTSVSLGCKVDAVPNYMAATASAKARSRWQSAPRHGNATPEKERGGSVKKRLSFPVLNP